MSFSRRFSLSVGVLAAAVVLVLAGDLEARQNALSGSDDLLWLVRVNDGGDYDVAVRQA